MKKTLTLRNVIFRYVLYCAILLCFSFKLSSQCSITGPPEVCLGESGDYTLSTNLTNVNIDWSVSSIGFITNETNTSATVSFMDEGNAVVSVEITNDFNVVLEECSFTTTVTSFPDPIFVAQVNNFCDKREEQILSFGLCEFDDAVYTANGQPNSTFEFSISGNATISDPFSNPVTVTTGAAGSALLCMVETTQDNCISEEVCVPIDIIQKPIASFEVEGHPEGCPLDICEGQQLTFVNTSADPDQSGQNLTNYLWEVHDLMTNLLIGSSTANDFNFTFNNNGSFVVTLSVQNACGCVSEEVACTIVVEDAPVHEIICPSIVCECEVETYSTPSVCDTYNWEFFVGTTLVGTGTGNPVQFEWCDIPPNNNGYGSVVLTTPGCSDFCEEPSVAIVPILPNEADIDGPTSVCGNDNANYEVPNWPGASYSWFFNGVLQTNGFFPYRFNATSLLNGYSGPFTITLEVVHNIVDCEFTATLEGFRSDYLIVVDDFSLCAGEDALLSLNPGPPSSPSFTIDWVVELLNGGVVYTETVANDVNVTVPANFLIPGNYHNVSAIVTIGSQIINCQDDYKIYVRDIVPPPTCLIEPNAVCVDNPYIYTICDPIVGATYNWTINGGVVNPPQGNSVEITYTQSDPLPIVSVVATLNGCDSEPLEFSPTILDNVSLEILGINGNNPNSEPCADGVEMYSSSILGLDNYQWSIDPPNAGSITSGENDEVVTILWHFVDPNTATLNLEIEGCNITPATLPITIIPEIDVVVDDPILACEGTPVNITVIDPDFGTSYEWHFGDNSTQTTAGNVVAHTYDEPGTFFGTVTVGGLPNCPGNFEGTFVVTVQEAPEAFITSPSLSPCAQDCENEIFSMTLYTEFFPNFTYQWQLNGADIPGAISATHTLTNDPANNNALGNYTVEVSDGNCTTTSNVYPVKCDCDPVIPCEKPLLEGVRITNIDLSSAQCGSVTVTGMIFGDMADVISGQWVLQDPTGSNPSVVSIDPNGPNTFSVTYLFTEPGFYPIQLRVFDTNRCLYLDNAVITVPLIADFDFTIECVDNESFFTYTFADDTEIISGANYSINSWTINGVVQNTTASVMQADLNLTGIYTVCINSSASINGIFDSCEHCETIIVPDAPSADFDFDENSTCEGQLIAFDPVAEADETTSYFWDFGDNSFSMLETPFKEYEIAGSYTVTLTIVTNYGCEATSSMVVVVADNNLGGQIVDILDGECSSSATLSFDPDGGAVIVAWEWSNNETTETIEVFQSGTYDVTVTDDNGCQFSPEPIGLLLDDAIPNGIVGPSEFCIDNSVYFSVNAVQGYTYNWLILGTTFTGNFSNFSWGTTPVPNPNLLEAGMYVVQVTAVNSNGIECETATHPFTVHPEPIQPELTITYACDPFTATVTSNVDVSWGFDNNGNYNFANIGFGNAVVLTTGGRLRVIYTDPLTGCTEYLFQMIENPIDFGPFLGGCYTACDTILDGSTYCIPGIPGSFDLWEWKKLALPDDITLATGSGTVPEYCPTPADEGKLVLSVSHTYTNTDGTPVVCTETSTPFCLDVEICSDSCQLEITYELICRDRESVDPLDDFWEIIMTVTGGPPGMSTWMATSPQVGDVFGTYGEPKQIFVGEIDEISVVDFVVDDYIMKPYCPTEITIEAPEPCSPHCFEAIVTVTDCFDNGTADPSDDYYEVYVDMSWVSQNPLVSFTFFQNNQTNPLGGGSTDGQYFLGQFSMNDPGWFLKIHADVYWDCQIDVEINVPEQCKCTLDVTYEAKCDDRGTFDPDDDFMRVCARVDNAPSGTWIINGNEFNNGETADFWVGEIDELSGPLFYEVYDAEWPNCNAEFSVDIPKECSPECFKVDIKEIKCNDNGTPNDPSDDTYEFCVTVIAEPGLEWQLTQNGSPFYFGNGSDSHCEIFDIADGGWMFKVYFPDYDADDQDCYPGEWITPPDPCSKDRECKLEAKIEKVECNNNGTEDPSDDTWSLVVCADGTISGDWIAGDPVNVMGMDGDCVTVNMGLISGYPNGYIEFKVYDPYFEECRVVLKTEVPKPCSDEIRCDIKARAYDITCHNNGTKDPSDDTWSFVLCGFGSPSGQWLAGDPVNVTGLNGECVTVDMGLISNYPGGVIEFKVYDPKDPKCLIVYKIIVPKDCSEDCGPKLEVKIAECFGDSYTVKIYASDDIGCYQVIQVLQGVETQLGILTSSNTSIEVGPFAIKDGCWTLKLYECETRKCEKTFLICPPKDCLVGCLNGESVQTETSTSSGDGFSGAKTQFTNWTFKLPDGLYPCPPKTIFLNGGFIRDVKVVYSKGQYIVTGEIIRGDGVLPNCFDIPICGGESNTPCDKITICNKENTDKRNTNVNSLMNDNLFVYPNPISKGVDLTVANIDWSDNINIDIKVVDAIGKVYLSNNMKTTHGEVKVSIETLSQGLYFVIVQRDGQQFVKPFTVM